MGNKLINQDLIPMAIVYDFDGTLAPGNMQEASFIPNIGMSRTGFWDLVKKRTEDECADMILMYMRCMLEEATANKVRVRREDFVEQGKTVKLFPGVQEWFERINTFGKGQGVAIQHYIVSSGNTEIIEGTLITSKFDRIYASKFLFDHNGVACWPARAVNYITKTEYLIRINKGAHDLSDLTEIDSFVTKDYQPVPFANIIYIGDGATDIPCFQKVTAEGGYSIAVFDGLGERAKLLHQAGHVHGLAPADYTKGKPLDSLVQAIIQNVSARVQFETARDELLHLLASTQQVCEYNQPVSSPTNNVSQNQEHIRRDQVSAAISATHILRQTTLNMAPYMKAVDHLSEIAEPYVKAVNQMTRLLEPHAHAFDQALKVLNPNVNLLNSKVLELGSLKLSPLPQKTLYSWEPEKEEIGGDKLA